MNGPGRGRKRRYHSSMDEQRTTARAFHDAGGVEDWRVLFSGAHAYFRVRSFAEGARFVAAIAEVANAVGHFPDVDVRPDGVTIRQTISHFSTSARASSAQPRPAKVEISACLVSPGK